MSRPQQQYQPASRWNKIPWGPVIGVAVVGIFLAIGFFAGRGSTNVDDLSVGDCFEDPGLADFSKVTDQDCALPHDIQIIGRVQANSLGLPQLDGIDGESLGPPDCEDKFFEILLDGGVLDDPSIVLPDDTVLGEIGERGVSFGGTSWCIVESPSGQLEGSLIPGR